MIWNFAKNFQNCPLPSTIWPVPHLNSLNFFEGHYAQFLAVVVIATASLWYPTLISSPTPRSEGCITILSLVLTLSVIFFFIYLRKFKLNRKKNLTRIIVFTPPPWAECSTRSSFKWSTISLNSEFPSPR